MIQPGQIGFSNTKGKIFLSGLIRFFTGSKFSHSFICYYPLDDMELVFEANELMMLTPFDRHYRNNPDQEYEIYEIKQFENGDAITKDMVTSSLKQCYLQYSNVKYGYTQLLWFIWRWILEKLHIKVDLKKERKWFKKGIICSELVYLYLKTLDHPIINEELNNFQPNTINPEDIRKIFLKYPEIFKLKEIKQ